MLIMGGSVYHTSKFGTRAPRVAFSKDGREWTEPKKLLAEDHWLWRVTWYKGWAWSVSKLGEGMDPRRGMLYRSQDGLDWEWITEFRLPNNTWNASETTLRFMPDDELIALTRPHWIGTSKPPYTDWSWTKMKENIGGPNFIRLPDGDLWAAERRYGAKATTTLARLTRDIYQPVLTLPSGGDNSYPGMVWHEGLLWMSYYSSHEGKTSVYLAKIKIKQVDQGVSIGILGERRPRHAIRWKPGKIVHSRDSRRDFVRWRGDRQSWAVLLDDPNVAKPNRVAVVLQKDGATLTFFALGCLATGWNRRKHIRVMDQHAVVSNRHDGRRGLFSRVIELGHSEIDIVGLPGKRRERHVNPGADHFVNSAAASKFREPFELAILVVPAERIDDLYFPFLFNVDAAVATLHATRGRHERATEFHVQEDAAEVSFGSRANVEKPLASQPAVPPFIDIRSLE